MFASSLDWTSKSIVVAEETLAEQERAAQERCPEVQVEAVLKYDSDVLLKKLSGLTEVQKRFIHVKHTAVYDTLRDLELMELQRRRQTGLNRVSIMEATRRAELAKREAIRQAEVKNILSGFPQIDILMTELLPSALFDRSHEEWKAWSRKNPQVGHHSAVQSKRQEAVARRI